MPPALPCATYRLQFTKEFGFDQATSIIPYLKSLGISHLYASPFLKARPGSTHGYDIVDHDRINPELGGEDSFYRMSDALRAHGLGLILDFVPNHMGVGQSDNAWWLDVLEWGQKSPHASTFDIDWTALPHRRHPGVLLPILGRPYGDAVQAGEIELKYDAETGSFAAWYFAHKLPINPQRYSEILRTLVNSAGAAGEPAGHELIALAHDYGDPRKPTYRDAPALKERIASIAGAASVIARGLDAYRAPELPLLHRLLERQHYRVAYWRVSFSAVNYRRFFDINDLAGIRVEDPKTFRAIHPLIARLIGEDRLQGLRLDHIDGLRDPAQYTRRLTQLIRKVRREAGLSPSFYIIVEKILADGEPMPHLPGVAGTTGYEWLNTISRLLVDDAGLGRLDDTWRAFTEEGASFPDMLDAAKLRVIESMLASEFTVLSRGLARIAAGHLSTRDYTIDRLRLALQLYLREFPVYRTYATAAGINEQDRQIVEQAIGRARARWRGPDPQIFDLLRDAITLDLISRGGYSAPRVRNFALKLQQFTGPLMAKALEDTTFYRHHRLLALNEVGGDPATTGLTREQFHERQQQRASFAPQGLTATATHDTKRGEDARARLLSLSEIAVEWRTAVSEWRDLNRNLVQNARDQRIPSKAHEYMLYQALIGAWPGQTNSDFAARMKAYALKAAREGKEETSWTNPDLAYEGGLADFVECILDPRMSAAFLSSFGTFAERTTFLGALNGLSQLALKVLLPGVPDFYQGTEHWDMSLVDPDNRRPVDFSRFEGAPFDEASLSSPLPRWKDGRVKLHLTRALLRLRAEHHSVLANGGYTPISVSGPHAKHVIAFRLNHEGRELVVAVGRHFAPLSGGGRHWPRGWQFALADIANRYQNALLSGEPVDGRDIAKRFEYFPLAVLASA